MVKKKVDLSSLLPLTVAKPKFKECMMFCIVIKQKCKNLVSCFLQNRAFYEQACKVQGCNSQTLPRSIFTSIFIILVIILIIIFIIILAVIFISPW